MMSLKSIGVSRKRPSPFRIKRGFPILIGTALIALNVGGVAVAQSQTRRNGPAPLSQSIANPALGGDCPVCLVEMGKEVKGRPDLQSVKGGKTYLFPSSDQKKMFDADPEKYVPAFNGYCSVCQVEMGELVPGSPEHFTVHEGKLFLFATADQKKMFDANPAKYAGVTLGLDGVCPVCLADGKIVPGKPEITASYDGVEYRFPSQKFKDMFLQDPEKYVPAAGGQCLVCKVDMNKNVLGSASHSLIVDGKPYLFVDEMQVEKFRQNPSKYMRANEDGSGTIRGGEVPSAGSSSRSNAKPKRSPGGSGRR